MLLLAALLGCSEGGSDEESQSACVFRGPYSLAYTLTAGSTEPYQPPPGPTGEIDSPLPGCPRGMRVVPTLQTTDTEACSAVVAYGDGAIEMECETGDPVALCTAESSTTYAFGERTCEYSWEMTRTQ